MDQVTTLVTPGQYGRYDAFGVLIEFLTPPDGEGGGYCLMRGTIPPRGAVPLHGHPDDESFLLLSGAIQGLVERDGAFEWFDIPPGGCVHVPANAKHAWRNVGDEPVVQLLVTTTRLGRFFREACRPLAGEEPLRPPTPEEIERFLRTADAYGHWIAGPEENARIGIRL